MPNKPKYCMINENGSYGVYEVFEIKALVRDAKGNIKTVRHDIRDLRVKDDFLKFCSQFNAYNYDGKKYSAVIRKKDLYGFSESFVEAIISGRKITEVVGMKWTSGSGFEICKLTNLDECVKKIKEVKDKDNREWLGFDIRNMFKFELSNYRKE